MQIYARICARLLRYGKKNIRFDTFFSDRDSTNKTELKSFFIPFPVSIHPIKNKGQYKLNVSKKWGSVHTFVSLGVA